MIGRWRRALRIFGLTVVAGVLAVIAAANVNGFLALLRIVSGFYLTVGVLLLVGTYYYDVLGVALGAFVFKRAITRERRRSAIYTEVFHNPPMADAVFADLNSANENEVRRAKDKWRTVSK